MSTCDGCGGEITFRYLGGAITPIHESGGCGYYEYSGDDFGSFQSSSYYRSPYTYESYVNPNASCPVCGDRVFFYQSPYGGRVFFDALGPPWPKHPCTDNSGYKPQPLSAASPISADFVYQWQSQGWKPFICTKLETNEGGFTRVSGKIEGKGTTLRLYIMGSSRWLGISPTLIKTARNSSKYSIATFSLDKKSLQIRRIELAAYLPTAAESKQKQKGRKTKKASPPF